MAGVVLQKLRSKWGLDSRDDDPELLSRTPHKRCSVTSHWHWLAIFGPAESELESEPQTPVAQSLNKTLQGHGHEHSSGTSAQLLTSFILLVHTCTPLRLCS